MPVEFFQLTRSTVGMIFWLTYSFLSLPAIAQPTPLTPTSTSVSESNWVAQETQYTLGAGDRIRVNIFQLPELSGEYLVLVDGTISLPLVGSIPVQGLTLEATDELLSKLYAAYLKRPLVTVGLIALRPLKIAIAGEITRPGSYTLEGGQTFPSITDIIQQAGGLTTTADISQVQIRRLFRGQEQVWQLDLWPLLKQGNLNQDVTLRDGDTIFIPTKDKIEPDEIRQLAETNFGIQVAEVDIAVVGEVYRPGSHTIRSEGVTTRGDINLRLPRLTLAIQQAGGIKPLADIRRIEVRRSTRTGSEQTLNVDLWQLLETGDLEQDIILQQGDTIVIPTAQELEPTESETLATASFAPNSIRVQVVGEVRGPGVIEVPPNTPLNQALLAAGGFDKRRARQGKVELIRLNPNGTVSKRDIRINFSSGINEANNPTLRNNDVVVVNRNTLTAATDTLSTIVSPLGSALGLFNLFRVFR